MAKVDEQGQVESGGFQIVDALCQVLVGKLLDTFDFDKKTVIHYQIRRIRADMLPLIGDWKRRLRPRPNATKVEFLNESPFVDLLQKPRS
jgi:hypothetical protein